jgi:hypothetical protein
MKGRGGASVPPLHVAMTEQNTLAGAWEGFRATCIGGVADPDELAFLRAAFYSGAQSMAYRLMERAADDASIDDLMAELAAFKDELLAAADCEQ